MTEAGALLRRSEMSPTPDPTVNPWLRVHGTYRRLSTALGLLVVATYLPVVRTRYGYSDDYALLFSFLRDPDWAQDLEMANGRPGMLALHTIGFAVAGDIDGLRWLRLLSVVGIATVAIVVMRLTIASGRRPIVAFSLAACVAALPPMQVVAAWSLLFVVPVSMLAAMAAAVLADRGRLIFAVGLMAVAVLTYQPAAMCFWLPVAIATTGPRAWPRSRQRAAKHFVVFAAVARLLV